MSFSIREDWQRGKPYIEVLESGCEWGEIHPPKRHFQFGVRKARMVLAANTRIYEFVASNGAEPVADKIVKMEDYEFGELFSCVRHNEFENSNGRLISAPFLKLFGRVHEFGFGLTKAKALILLEDEIRGFVNKYR